VLGGAVDSGPDFLYTDEQKQRWPINLNRFTDIPQTGFAFQGFHHRSRGRALRFDGFEGSLDGWSFRRQ
jgi:hypothetical protein